MARPQSAMEGCSPLRSFGIQVGARIYGILQLVLVPLVGEFVYLWRCARDGHT